MWEAYPTRFEWLVSLAAYGFIAQKFNLHRRALAWARAYAGRGPKVVRPLRDSPALSASDPASDVDDGVCQSDLILMDINGSRRPFPLLPAGNAVWITLR